LVLAVLNILVRQSDSWLVNYEPDIYDPYRWDMVICRN